MTGALMFARYAYPPNALGYCGPADHRALLEYGATGEEDGGLRALIGKFENAPYFGLIAAAAGVADPLDRRVVEAYWVGNDLLERVRPDVLQSTLDEWMRRRAGSDWERIARMIWAGGVPNHSFHVFGVYPWVGLLRAGYPERPLEVLDRCRIRWGRVIHAANGLVSVRSRPLVWDGSSLKLGQVRVEEVVAAVDGYRLAGPLRPGDVVALHWDWVCDRLRPAQLRALRHCTEMHLALANQEIAQTHVTEWPPRRSRSRQ